MYDVAIIGAGVTGSAIARELSRYQLNVCVIEREEDVCCGTSKANSAIIHAGFDAVPGTLKAKVNVKGNAMMDQIAKELDIPFKRNGSMVVCTKDQDPKGLEVLMERGKANGVPDLQILDRKALIAMEPNLSDDDGSVQDWYYLISYSVEGGHPGMIIEHAYMDNAHDNAILKNEEKLKAMGVADADAIADYYGLEKK